MRKETKYLDPSNKDVRENKVLQLDKIKTTNVNVLLNRVRLDQKNFNKWIKINQYTNYKELDPFMI